MKNIAKIASLDQKLTELEKIATALGTTDGTITESVQAMNASMSALSEKVTATEARFAAAGAVFVLLLPNLNAFGVFVSKGKMQSADK